MLKRLAPLLRPSFAQLRSRAFSSASRGGVRLRTVPGIALSSTAVVAYVLWHVHTRNIHNDSGDVRGQRSSTEPQLIPGGAAGESEELLTVVWGSNRSNTLTPLAGDSIRTPSIAKWLDGVALRDLCLHRNHAACVDARGDVYQWGATFAGDDPDKRGRATLTLKNKNIVQLKLTEGRVYALSASGKIYALSAFSAEQKLKPGMPTPASDSWWGTGWLWGEEETIDFVEITPKDPLAWGEKFTSIVAGNDHLLAVTSNGRAFAHPVTKKANTYAQLGFRRFQILHPDSQSHPKAQKTYIDVELVPQAIMDPYARSSRSVRPTPPEPSKNLDEINDNDIRFCTHIYEIPILKDVQIAQVAAGARHSFARTKTGRVLGWGANEYGQIGLGSEVVVNTITVPTEVILWRTAPPQTQTICVDVTAGGDLTAFTVMHVDEHSPVPAIDLLMCGNGQWGGLGSNIYSNAQGTPLKARNVSGLVEFSEEAQSLQPLGPDAVSISPTGHVLLTLATTGEVGGRDLILWGKNYEYELGNGKKTSVPVPTSLETPEGGRFMLRTRTTKDVKDLHGKTWKHDVRVEQAATTGFGSSVVYWKIVS